MSGMPLASYPRRGLRRDPAYWTLLSGASQHNLKLRGERLDRIVRLTCVRRPSLQVSYAVYDAMALIITLIGMHRLFFLLGHLYRAPTLVH